MNLKQAEIMESSSVFNKLKWISLGVYFVIIGSLLVCLFFLGGPIYETLHQHIDVNEPAMLLDMKASAQETLANGSIGLGLEDTSAVNLPILAADAEDFSRFPSLSLAQRTNFKDLLKEFQGKAEALQSAFKDKVKDKNNAWHQLIPVARKFLIEIEKTRKDLQRMRDYDAQYVHSQETVLAGVVTLFAIIGIIAIAWIARSFKFHIWEPVSQILRYTQKIEQGDLSGDPVDLQKMSGMDELGKIARAVGGLGKTIRSIFQAIQSHGADAGQIAASLDDHCRSLVEHESDTARAMETFQQRMEDGLTLVEDFKVSAVDVQHDTLDVTGRLGDLALSSSQMLEQSKEMNNAIKTCNQTADSLIRNTDMVHGELSRVRDGLQETHGMAEILLKGALEGSTQAGLVAGAVDDTGANVEEIMAGNHQVMENIRQMDQNMETTFNQLESLLGSIKLVDERIRESTSFSKEVAKTATEGSQIVEQAIEKMREIKAMVQATTKQIKDLGSSSQEITNVVSTITALAEQTNLLALNAAIEAARAGEEGQGFAVVADKVRVLADKSGRSAKEIESHIIGVQQETDKVVQGMVEWSRHVEEGVSLADHAGKKMGAIVEKVRQANLLQHEIHQNTQEQARKSDRVKQVVDKLANASQTIRASVHEQELGGRRMVEAIVLLRDIAHHLKNVSVEQEESGRAIVQTLQQHRDSVESLNRRLGDHRHAAISLQRNLQSAGRHSSEIYHLGRQQNEKHKDLQNTAEHLVEETRRFSDKAQAELSRLQQIVEDLRIVGRTSRKGMEEAKDLHADARVLTTTIQQLLDILVDFRLDEMRRAGVPAESASAPAITGIRTLEA